MKILLGGIPLGCDNIGDEAIIACAVLSLQRLFPQAELAVATARPGSNQALQKVRQLPLFGFDGEKSFREFKDAITEFDAFVWAGATGLSDYPAVGVRLLKLAQQAGLATALWNVGMNDTFNPAFFQAQGRRRVGLQLLSRLTGGSFDAVKAYESWLVRRMYSQLASALHQCAAVVVRDQPSQARLAQAGFAKAIVGADNALLQPGADLREVPEQVRQWRQLVTVGVSLSAQQPPNFLDDLRGGLEQFLLADDRRRLLFIPMNPITDLALMRSFQQGFNDPQRTLLLTDCQSPAVIQAIASCCRLIVSSRLHLLVLAANAGTPFLGISRGSKIDNFLAEFGQSAVGDVDQSCASAILESMEAKLSEEMEASRQHLHAVRQHLLQRLALAGAALQQALAGRAPQP